MPSGDDVHPADTSASDADAEEAADLPWVGYWKVLRWNGQSPAVPTYYVATQDTWDVVKDDGDALSVAPHPILEPGREAVVLKDEGADDTDRERWEIEVSGDRLTVTARTGPHEGATGVAERIPTGPFEAVGDEASAEDA
jgi:hypothetical protein